MNIEEQIKIVKNMLLHAETQLLDYEAIAIETLLTAYEEKCKELKKEIQDDLDVRNRWGLTLQELEKEKEKNNKIDEFCRKELAFERRLQRENREPDEFNQGRFYVSENIRKIIKEE